MRIEKFRLENYRQIKHLPPKEWNFDIISFVKLHFDQDYFYSFIAVENNRIVGFGNIFLFDKHSWLGNIIIKSDFRGKGYGTEITKFLMNFSIEKGAESLRLFATKDGFPIYKKLGFAIEEYYKFYRLNDKRTVDCSINLIECNERVFSQVLDLDFSVNGENREKLLRKLYSKIKVSVNAESIVRGYCIPDFGNGYIISIDSEHGIEMAKFISNMNMELVVPESNIAMHQNISNSDYILFKEAPRMWYGKKMTWKPEYIFSRGTGYCA